jgi:hypothetical protein
MYQLSVYYTCFCRACLEIHHAGYVQTDLPAAQSEHVTYHSNQCACFISMLTVLLGNVQKQVLPPPPPLPYIPAWGHSRLCCTAAGSMPMQG